MSVRRRPLDGGHERGRAVSRYDLLLAVLPVPILAGAVAGTLSALPTLAGVGLGGLVSSLLVCYGLFYDAPAARSSVIENGVRRDSSAD